MGEGSLEKTREVSVERCVAIDDPRGHSLMGTEMIFVIYALIKIKN